MNDVTHLGWFDIPLLSNIPGLTYLCPTCEKEYFAMMDWAIGQRAVPVAIRQPENGVADSGTEILADYSTCGYDVVRKGREVAVIALGSFFQRGEELCHALAEKGVAATLINPRAATLLDRSRLDALAKDHRLVVTLEDGVIPGGFGEKVARYCGPSAMKVLVKGAAGKFADRYDYDELLKANGLLTAQMRDEVLALLAEGREGNI